jgi:hypothetical protein
MQSFHSLWVIRPVLQSTSRRFETLLELSKVLSDSARVLSGALESTCSYGGAFRMVQDMMYRRVKLGSLETSGQICRRLREQPSAQRMPAGDYERSGNRWASSAGDFVPYSNSTGCCGSTTTWHVIYHIHLYNHLKIRSILIGHVLSNSLNTYIYNQSGQR